MDPLYWWIIIGILLFLLEIFTPGFFAASLGIGAFGAAITAFAGGSLEWQLVVFSIVSVTSIFALRPLIKKYMYETDEVKTNADALIGRTGKVVKEVDKSIGQGRCAIDGDEWQFELVADTHKVKVGQKIRVLKRDSIILTVEPVN